MHVIYDSIRKYLTSRLKMNAEKAMSVQLESVQRKGEQKKSMSMPPPTNMAAPKKTDNFAAYSELDGVNFPSPSETPSEKGESPTKSDIDFIASDSSQSSSPSLSPLATESVTSAESGMSPLRTESVSSAESSQEEF